MILRTVGTQPEFGFKPLDHVELLERRGWADFARARKVAGERAYALTSDLVLLERAIVRRRDRERRLVVRERVHAHLDQVAVLEPALLLEGGFGDLLAVSASCCAGAGLRPALPVAPALPQELP